MWPAVLSMSLTTCSCRAAALFISQNRFYTIFTVSSVERMWNWKYDETYREISHWNYTMCSLFIKQNWFNPIPFFFQSFNSSQSGKSGWPGQPVKGDKTNIVFQGNSQKPVVEQIFFCVDISQLVCVENPDDGLNNNKSTPLGSRSPFNEFFS